MLSTAESEDLMDRNQRGLGDRPYGFWALEVPGEVAFGGFLGIVPVPPEMPFAPAIEIGWRLARPLWGRGLASEAARRRGRTRLRQSSGYTSSSPTPRSGTNAPGG